MTKAEIGESEVVQHAASEPFIRYDPASWGGRIVAKYMEASDLSPDVVCDLDALETIAILVAQGLGNALVPAWQGLVPQGFNLVVASSGTAFSRNILFLQASVPARPKAVNFLRQLLQHGGG
ncbi:LysR substrate-binding domain-containing protein [Pararhizobium sp. A13]|uniref:LysR substrate-binding domain-containing protein n=1 Tax=Pararhizobium sp. A13 TaxID=3133975 RepID=UPI00311B191D